MNTLTNKKGFTIIEVVLVLAIAGLIFLMVFIALPALQRGQRDSQRQSDISQVATQISNFQNSNRGAIPTNSTFANFRDNYFAVSDLQDPQHGPYQLVWRTSDTNSVGEGEIHYRTGVLCANDGSGGSESAGSRNFTLRISMEGQDVPHCVDNR